ncbi:MAG TPA: hypothetical protein VJJ46_01325 [Anaerolineales bacterium]|nr:hypothetical protein [Anaerolineales bacterium]
MFLAVRSRAGGGRQLEAWLGEVLVPVEPSSVFTRRLRARLVSYRGDRLASIWMVLAVVGTSLLLLVAISSLALRLAIAILGGIHLLARRRQARVGARPRLSQVGDR